MRAAAGLLLVAVCAATFAVGASSAVAQSQEDQATITREAYFTRPVTQVAPPLLFEGLPPSTICLVAGLIGLAQLCGEEVRDLVNAFGLSQGIPIPVTPDSHLIQSAPGTLPVGMLGGQERWLSALQLQLPVLPEGEQFTSFELVLQQDGFNFALESPAFRALVLAVVTQLQETNPEVIIDVVSDVVSAEMPGVTETITGIEACPALGPWSGGAAQDAALDGSRLPEIDCVRGTTGRLTPETGTWVFDITFAVQAWTGAGDDGETLVNEGIFLRPLGAPNLAFGDPDVSTNFLVSLAGSDNIDEDLRPRIRYTTGPLSSAVFEGPAAFPADFDLDPVGPTVIPAEPGVPGTAGEGTFIPGAGGFTARWADLVRGEAAGIPLWAILLIPLALGGAYLFGGALVSSPDAVRRRPGALSRMMERRGG